MSRNDVIVLTDKLGNKLYEFVSDNYKHDKSSRFKTDNHLYLFKNLIISRCGLYKKWHLQFSTEAMEEVGRIKHFSSYWNLHICESWMPFCIKMKCTSTVPCIPIFLGIPRGLFLKFSSQSGAGIRIHWRLNNNKIQPLCLQNFFLEYWHL